MWKDCGCVLPWVKDGVRAAAARRGGVFYLSGFHAAYFRCSFPRNASHDAKSGGKLASARSAWSTLGAERGEESLFAARVLASRAGGYGLGFRYVGRSLAGAARTREGRCPSTPPENLRFSGLSRLLPRFLSSGRFYPAVLERAAGIGYTTYTMYFGGYPP